jgi:hypothetical protein
MVTIMAPQAAFSDGIKISKIFSSIMEPTLLTSMSAYHYCSILWGHGTHQVVDTELNI